MNKFGIDRVLDKKQIEWANALVPPTPPLRGGEAGVGGDSHTCKNSQIMGSPKNQ